MNIPLSLLIYNPIEAYTLILLGDIITGNDTKFNKKSIVALWVFGTVNFVIQFLPNLVYGENCFLFVSFISNYLIIPVSMLFFYNLVSFKINYFTCLMCQIINCLFILIIVSIFNSIAYSYNLFCPANRFHEFISNFVIFFMQIMLYTIINHRRFYYEKCCKNHRK